MEIKRIFAFAAAWLAAFSLFAESVNIRTTYMNGKTDVRTVELKKISDSVEQLDIPKSELTKDVKYIDVLPNFATAKKGDKGYWIHSRGIYGNFDKDNGKYDMKRQVIPVWGVKTDGKTFWANVKSCRFDYSFNVVVKDGKYEIFPRFDVEGIRKWFDPYQDIVIDFNFLKGKDANYSGMGRGYRKYQLDRGAVRTIKDRMKDQPDLKYICDAPVIRIQTHAAKAIPDKHIDFSKDAEPPVVVHMPFGVAAEFMQAIKDSGVDKAVFVSAGWNDGGYDGRLPAHFPVCAEAEGEEGLRRMIEKAKDLGFLVNGHIVFTDSYTVSPMWDESYVCKRRDGSLFWGGLWAGGRAYLPCQRAAWDQWARPELDRIKKLGFCGPAYVDVLSATYPNRCCDSYHPATPEVMAEYQNKILAYCKKIFGSAASEGGYDHVAGNIDYLNYVDRIMKNYADHPERYPLVKGVYPLWEIVYHGIILYNSDRITQNHTRGKCLYKLEKSGDPRWMEGDGIEDPKIALKIVEFGGRPIFYTYKFADVPRIKKAYDEFVPVRYLQKELMHSHEKIAPNVFVTEYEDGTKVVSNYNDKPFKYENTEVSPLFYKIFPPKK